MSFTDSLDELVEENANGLLASHPTWQRVPLGFVFDVQNGFPFESRYFNASAQGFPLLRIRDVLRGMTDTYYSGKFDHSFLVKFGDLVVGMDGDFNARPWRGPPSLLNQRVCRLLPRGEHYSSQFLAYVLPGYLNAINARTSSITVKHLSSKTIEEIPLPLPSLAEQQRIVEAIDAYLSRLDAAVASLERVQSKLKAYRASILKAAVEGRLVPTEASIARAEKRNYEPANILLARILKERRKRWEQNELAKLKAAGKTPKDDKWKAKYEEPAGPDAKNLPELPEGWCWATVDQLAALKGGVTKGQKRAFDDELVEVPYLRVANVQRGYLDLSEVKTIQATPAEVNDLRLERGDVLFNEGGDRDKLGRGWVWNAEIATCIHQNHVFRARILTLDLEPRFLSWYGNSSGQRYFFDEGKQTTNLASLNLTKLKALPVPIPPRAEQDRIVEEVERLLSISDESSTVVSHGLHRCARLRQAILKWAFEGKLTDQNPSDEPAALLLKRIQNQLNKNNAPQKSTRAQKHKKP